MRITKEFSEAVAVLSHRKRPVVFVSKDEAVHQLVKLMVPFYS